MKQSTKNILLIAGFSLILAVAYQYSFSKTFEVKRELNNLRTLVKQNSGSLQNINSLEEKEKYLESVIQENRIGYTSLQNRLLQVLNNHSKENSFKIVSFKEPHVTISQSDEEKNTSFQFALEGEYKALEKILFILETEHNFGSLSHLSFERKKDYRMSKSFLQCSVVVQNIE